MWSGAFFFLLLIKLILAPASLSLGTAPLEQALFVQHVILIWINTLDPLIIDVFVWASVCSPLILNLLLFSLTKPAAFQRSPAAWGIMGNSLFGLLSAQTLRVVTVQLYHFVAVSCHTDSKPLYPVIILYVLFHITMYSFSSRRITSFCVVTYRIMLFYIALYHIASYYFHNTSWLTIIY